LGCATMMSTGGSMLVALSSCIVYVVLFFFFFFFQAEDGIRDFHVTGVQTCALPICAAGQPRPGDPVRAVGDRGTPRPRRAGPGRSEERRVGKECRSRGSPYH